MKAKVFEEEVARLRESLPDGWAWTGLKLHDETTDEMHGEMWTATVRSRLPPLDGSGGVILWEREGPPRATPADALDAVRGEIRKQARRG